jgi:hypothetical protein
LQVLVVILSLILQLLLLPLLLVVVVGLLGKVVVVWVASLIVGLGRAQQRLPLLLLRHLLPVLHFPGAAPQALLSLATVAWGDT